MVALKQQWPEWWDWEIDCSNPHLAKRMIDRSFSETDLRLMLEQATAYRADVELGRWIIETRHAKKDWEVIVEPDQIQRLLVVVTAYQIG